MDVIRVLIIAVSTIALIHLTPPSFIYHWIRGQDNFKLYLLKAVFEISDLLLKNLGISYI